MIHLASQPRLDELMTLACKVRPACPILSLTWGSADPRVGPDSLVSHVVVVRLLDWALTEMLRVRRRKDPSSHRPQGQTHSAATARRVYYLALS